MRDADRVNFVFLGMQDIEALINIPLRRDFLPPVANFWDLVRHVFVVNSQELCPTVEEFRIISGIKVSDVPTLPPFRLGYAAELMRLCGCFKEQSRKLIQGSSLDVMGIARLFKGRVYQANVAFVGHRQHALFICIMVGFLLASSLGIPSVRLIDVVAQFMERYDLIPLVLAETIDGLDKLRNGETTVFGGSPMLL